MCADGTQCVGQLADDPSLGPLPTPVSARNTPTPTPRRDSDDNTPSGSPESAKRSPYVRMHARPPAREHARTHASTHALTHPTHRPSPCATATRPTQPTLMLLCASRPKVPTLIVYVLGQKGKKASSCIRMRCSAHVTNTILSSCWICLCCCNCVFCSHNIAMPRICSQEHRSVRCWPCERVKAIGRR
jgi:hypothetical protein